MYGLGIGWDASDHFTIDLSWLGFPGKHKLHATGNPSDPYSWQVVNLGSYSPLGNMVALGVTARI